jgi:hypothetical protein
MQYLYNSSVGCEPYKAYANDQEVEAAIMEGSKLEKPTKCAPKM